MNPGSKRLRLSPSKHPGPPSTAGPPSSSPPRFSHDALPLSLAAGSRVEEEEEEEGYLVVEEDATDSSLIITMEDSQLEARRRRPARSRKRKVAEEESEGEVEIDRQLDQSLETKSRQHNLTTVNVKNIIHEVITNEHVVAMMKAAINETEARPPFEPKMTRSKLKEVVERGVVIPAWNISPIKKPGDVRKFVDILLAEEDSSDEEYRPDEEEEDETAEDTFQESDLESLAPSPRGSRGSRLEEDSCSPWQMSRSSSRRGRRGFASMGPPPPPRAQPPKAVTDSSFLEKLHAVEEELAVCMKPFQPLSESEDHVGLISYRTRSKRPLRDVPLGQLEAELRAPDITPDMYDSSSAHEDREWTDWLRGLMNTEMDNEEECDDEDDPEYNFLADTDEPDLEDYRDDKAVRITKKEVNQLMEELFQTLKEDLAGQEVEDEGREEEEDNPEESRHADVRAGEEEEEEQQQHAGPIRELRTVKQQLVFLRRKPLSQQTHTHPPHPEPHTLRLAPPQRLRLQQQLQQHVQLLTQIHLLSSPVARLHSEAETTRQFLFELDLLAQRGELLTSAGYHGYRSIFRASNLQPARRLLEEVQQNPISYQPKLRPPDARGYMRCHPIMPAELAWLFATRSVFLHPELLPCASLDPALYCPRRTSAFTAAEDCLLVLGLRNMEGSVDPPKMVSQFLVRKTLVQVRRRILQCCRPGFPDNLVKAYRYQGRLEAMPVACRHVHPAQQRPPVEREEHLLPLWLARSLPVLQLVVSRYNSPRGSPQTLPLPHRSGGARHSHMSIARSMSKSTSRSCSFPPGTRYPERLPGNLDLKRIGFVLLQQPDSHTPGSAPLADGHTPGSAPLPDSGSRSSSTPPPLSCPRMLKKSISTVSLTTTEKIQLHFQTLIGLRRRQDGGSEAPPSPPQSPTPSQVEAAETQDINGSSEEEEEEQSEVCLALSESSSEELLEPPEVEPEQEQRRNPDGAEGGEPREEEEEPEDARREEEEEGDDARRQQQEQLFAQEYLLRVCAAVHRCPDVAEQLLQVLDGFSAAPAPPERLYGHLRGLLGPWPQLLRDFAAFLTRRQARRCGLLLEQQLFQRSRRFLWRLGRSLGEGSALYHQVVSVLQRSSASTPEDLEKVAPLLQHHPDLQEELRGLFQQFHHCSLSMATANRDMKAVFESPDGMTTKEECEETDTGRDAAEEAGPPVMARQVSAVPSGGTAAAWTREADRAILVACQQRGASWDTFTHVSAQLGDRTAQQVSLRFQDLMRLFYSAFQNAGS